MHSMTLLEADHEVDAQSIYGCEQMPIMRRPTQTHLPISENDDEENDEDEMDTINGDPKMAFERSISHVLSRPVIVTETPQLIEQQPPPKKIRRWFETGSVESVHLGSSEYIFAEKTRDSLPLKGIVEADNEENKEDSNGIEQTRIK